MSNDEWAVQLPNAITATLQSLEVFQRLGYYGPLFARYDAQLEPHWNLGYLMTYKAPERTPDNHIATLTIDYLYRCLPEWAMRELIDTLHEATARVPPPPGVPYGEVMAAAAAAARAIGGGPTRDRCDVSKRITVLDVVDVDPWVQNDPVCNPLCECGHPLRHHGDRAIQACCREQRPSTGHGLGLTIPCRNNCQGFKRMWATR